MTREEAIRILTLERDDWETSHCSPMYRREAFQMAIEALNQFAEDSKKVSAEGQDLISRQKDLISREVALTHIDDVPYIKDHPNVGLLWKAWIENLPSAQPKRTQERTETHSCDLISRAMLLEYIHNEPVGKMLCDKYNLDGVIKQLPSAQPERKWIPCSNPPKHHKDVIVRGIEAIGNVTVHKVMQWDVDTWRPTDYAPSVMWKEWSEI